MDLREQVIFNEASGILVHELDHDSLISWVAKTLALLIIDVGQNALTIETVPLGSKCFEDSTLLP